MKQQDYQILFWEKLTEKGRTYAISQAAKAGFVDPFKWAHDHGKELVKLGYVKMF